ncbi:TIGR00645 family protein [soil metagenome]
MPEPEPTPKKDTPLLALEHGSERFLFGSRWLLAPLYLGMVIALLAIVVKFFQELWHLVTHLIGFDGEELILSILALLDLTLLANLVLIVIFAGYENFVSKIAVARRAEDRPSWMGHVDFSGLKMKLIGSIVAISAIGLLQDFTGWLHYDSETPTAEQQFWRIILHVTFLLSGVGFAFMDWLGERRLILAKISHSDD